MSAYGEQIDFVMQLHTRHEAKKRGYCPQVPTERQAEFLKLDCLEALFGGAGGGGKLLRVDEPIATPSGWTTMGDLQPGDMVFDCDGNPTRVAWCSAIERNPDALELTFDDGSTIECDAGHQWVTCTEKDRMRQLKASDEWRAKRRAKRPSRVSGKKSEAFAISLAARNAARAKVIAEVPPPRGTTKTTQEIVDTLLHRNRESNHSILNAGSLQLPESVLLIDPYTLGAWLGDGTSCTGVITKGDHEVYEAIESSGQTVRKVPSTPLGHRVEGLTQKLAALGVLNAKHIPQMYLRASEAQRIALLQGLCDTDGFARPAGSIEFTTTTRALRDGFCELLASLGIKFGCTEGRATLYGRDISAKWRINFSTEIPCFRIGRKAERQKLTGFRGTHARRYIVSARRVPATPMRCIAVDAESHTYLAGRNMIPTHNSSALLMAALQYVHVPDYHALILRRTFRDLNQSGAIMDRAKDWLMNTDASWNQQAKRWTFPSGASLTFGYLDSEQDRFQYAGANYTYIAYDELTQFPEKWYQFLFSRLRRASDSKVPLRMRGATNPGGIGHAWVRRRFVDEETREGTFIPSLLSDNPHIDQQGYRESLSHLDAVTRAQLEQGVWRNDASGLVYNLTEAINCVPAAPLCTRYVLGIDFALTRDACGFTIVGWRPDDPNTYVLRSYKKKKMIPSAAAEEILMLGEQYKFERIIGDANGLGHAYVAEARRRWGIPIEEADKNNKRGYISLLNGDLEKGRIKIVKYQCESLIAEMLELPWEDDGRTKEAEGFAADCSDALLYAYRASRAYSAGKTQQTPKPLGTGFTKW